MIIIVILSPPIPCDARGSALTMSSSISAPISCGRLLLIRSWTYFTHSSLERQSQIPSQPNMMNSSPSLSVVLLLQVVEDERYGSDIEDATPQIMNGGWMEETKQIIRKSNTHLKMSGSAVIICSLGGIPGTCLYFKSPIERDRFKFPFTLPN